MEKWRHKDIGDQTGRVVIVTGSSSGIGYEAARVLAHKGAELILAVRNQQKGDAALNKIKQQNDKAKVQVRILDLANLKSVAQFAKDFSKSYERLDILINNAGVMIPPYSQTSDGFELQMGTNHLGHFALTVQLLPVLKKTPGSRVVNVSSMAHMYGHIDFDDLNWEERKYKPIRAYGDSKIANLYFTYALADKLQKIGIDVKVTAAHPGWTATDLQRHSGLFNFLNRFFAQDVKMGALPTLRAAVDPDAENGSYYGPAGWREWKGYPVRVQSNKLSQNREIAEKLWRVSEQLTDAKFEGLQS